MKKLLLILTISLCLFIPASTITAYSNSGCISQCGFICDQLYPNDFGQWIACYDTCVIECESFIRPPEEPGGGGF